MMASDTPLSCTDDFVMLDARHISDLPLRRKPPAHEADHESGTLSSDDDLEHVSRPDSVRSFDTPSPVSSPVLSPALVEATVISSPTSQSKGTTTQHVQSPGLHKSSTGNRSRLEVQGPAITERAITTISSTCYNHETIDQQIMDVLIEHALTTRIKQEHGQDSAKDKQLRQQMLSRFRSLPVNHSVVKDCINHTQGRKVLFQGQARSSRDVEDIYRTVFTNVERMALNFLTACHLRHFETACTFSGSFMTTSRENLHHAMLQDGADAGKALALSVNAMVMERLDLDRSFTELYDDLRQQSRSSVNALCIAYMKAAINKDWSPRLRVSTIRQTIRTTLGDLPNDRYPPEDSLNSHQTASSMVLKRGCPEDGKDREIHIPSPKRFQPRSLYWESAARDGFQLNSCTGGDEPSQKWSPEARPEDTCKRAIFVWNGPDRSWRVTEHEYNAVTNSALQDINRRLERFYEFGDSHGTINDSKRQHGVVPLRLRFFLLDQQCKKAWAQCHQSKEVEQASTVPSKMSKTLSPDPYLEPVGYLRENLEPFNVEQNDIASSNLGQIWLCEHASRCAQLTSDIQKADLVDRMMKDRAIARHITEHGLSALDYAFKIDSFLLFRCMQFAYENGLVSEEKAAAPQQPESIASQVGRSRPRTPQREQTVVTESKKPTMAAPKSTVPEVTTARSAPNRPQNRHARQAYQMQLMLLEQQNCRRRLEDRMGAKRLEEGKPLATSFVKKPENNEAGKRKGPLKAQNVADTPREYQLDTLLATSTHHPVQAVNGAPETAKIPVLNPAHYPTPITPPPISSSTSTEIGPEVVSHEGVQTKGKEKDIDTATLPEVNPSPASKFRLDPNHWDPVSAIVEHDYQHQLWLLEQQSRRRIELAKQEQKMLPLSAPVITISKGGTYIGFRHTHSGMDAEYVIRANIEFVNTNLLSPSFKDDNCLHASCQGWKSTAERIREAQNKHWTDLRNRMNVAVRTPKQEDEPAHVLRQKREENRIAWSLAKLNPCLRSHAMDDLLRAAVNHFINLKGTSLVQKRNTLAQDKSKEVAQLANRPICKPEQTQFILASPESIMEDPDLESSSSSSSSSSEDEDEHEDCDDEGSSTRAIVENQDEEEASERLPFPRRLEGADGCYVMFWSGTMPARSQSFYTVRADIDNVILDTSLKSFSERNCLCHRMWSDKASDRNTHDGDCQVGIKLAYLNPTLQGKENEELRYAATMNHALLTGVAWPRRRSIRLEMCGVGKVLNWEMPESDMYEAFSLFRQFPPPHPLQAHCRYCNQILERSHHVDRVVHMACCEWYRRSRAAAHTMETYRQKVASSLSAK